MVVEGGAAIVGAADFPWAKSATPPSATAGSNAATDSASTGRCERRGMGPQDTASRLPASGSPGSATCCAGRPFAAL